MSAYTEIPKIIAETGALPPKVLGYLDSLYPSTSTKRTEIHVETDGDDTYDGTPDAPYRTIARAIQALPNIIREGHYYTIHIGEGEFNEPIDLRNVVVDGALRVFGTTTTRQNHRVRSVYAEKITGFLFFKDLTTTDPDIDIAWHILRCSPYVRFDNVGAIGNSTPVAGTRGILIGEGSKAFIYRSDFSGRRYGIRVDFLSTAISHSNTGTNNEIGIATRWGGHLATWGTQPEGDMSALSGGIISQDRGVIIGHQDLHVINEKRHEDDAPMHREWTVHSDTNNALRDPGTLDNDTNIRLRFNNPTDGVYRYRVSVGGMSSLTTLQWGEMIIYAAVRAGQLRSVTHEFVGGDFFRTENIQYAHSYGTVHNLTIHAPNPNTPLLPEQWGITVECTNLYGGPAPYLQVIDRVNR